ncbi:YfgM family protein [Gallaecimonas sp. GXIMD1310]|uniref:YfgM family protein n=1 Tax=Gallaecimonas sp. GXIMD1310 TaxID=3131926 RepID=UPI003251E58A
MEVYSTEEQQVEAIKRFWKEHGNGIMAGTVIGLAGIYGWHWYSDHQLEQQEASSAHYAAVMKEVDGGDVKAGEAFIKSDAAGQYPALMAAVLAKKAADKGDLDKAIGYLEQGIAHTKNAELTAIYSLRMARIQLAKGDTAGAKATVAKVTAPAFKGEVQELLGDIAVKEGDTAAARSAYQLALTDEPGASAVLNMKIQSLDSNKKG